MPANLLQKIPSVNELLENPTLKALIDRVSHNTVVSGVRGFLDELRKDVKQAAETAFPSVTELAEKIASRILHHDRPRLRPVVNATGILLHTGLGRAPLAEEAIVEMAAVARDYASVELDLADGERSQRVWAVEGLLRELTGAEAALVVNNNAGATMLTLAAMARGREVVVSRGELIEIGGSYRLPDVMSTSGAILREVGTTNKTRTADYAAAINEHTAALLLVHTSNYKIVGFTAAVPLAELVELGRTRQLPVIHDIGSGALIDFSRWGCGDEPIAAASIAAGADLVLFSGDKLLGGPQCGIIVGRKKYVEQIAKHPMTRALRVDKLTFAALAATLRLYRQPSVAAQRIPLLQLLDTPLENLKLRAERLAAQLGGCPAVGQALAVADIAYLGGGSMPTQELHTWCVEIQPRRLSVDKLATLLRTGAPAVVGRVQRDRLLLDLRSVFPRQDHDLIAAIQAAAAPTEAETA